MNSITTTPTSKLPLYFRLKKYLLMGLIFATIAIYIFFILNFASKMNKGEEGSSSAGGAHNKPPTGEQAFKPLTNTYNVSRTALIVLIVIFAFFILFQLLGTIGTLREYFCITCTYVILQFAISVVNFILITFYGSTLWGAASWSLLVLVFGLIYLRDLYLIHIGEEKQQVEQQTRRSSSLQIGSSGGGGGEGDGTVAVVRGGGDPEIGF